MTTTDVNMILDLIWAVEVLRDRLPEDEQLSKHEVQAVIIQETAIQYMKDKHGQD